jgi:hypothetical protein
LSTKDSFYVYALFRPDGTPCYVGKGSGSRWKNHEWMVRAGLHYNKHLASIISNAGGALQKFKIRTGLTNKQSKEYEVAFIASYGRVTNGGTLVNLTDGGDGKADYVTPQKTKDLIGKGNTGKTRSGETKAQMSRDRKNIPKSLEHRAKIGDGNRGKVVSDETRAKQRKPKSDGAKESLKAFHAGMTPEQRAKRSRKISEATKLAMADPAVRGKIAPNRRASQCRTV